MKIIKFLILTYFFLFIQFSLRASEPGWTVTALDNPAPGYIIFEMVDSPGFFVVDNYGNEQYPDTVNNNSFMISDFKYLENGIWVGYSLKINVSYYYLFNQKLELIDSISYPADFPVDYHDIISLSNGHYLLLCYEYINADLSKIVHGGQDNAQIISNVLVETDRTGKIYWTWKAFDHLQITDATPDINLTQNAIDFTHANSLTEDKDGNIIISFRHLDEIMKIKKDSTGQIIWRFGGSMCKNNEFTFINDSNNDNHGFVGFSHQHSISLLPNGNILMFDNGNLKIPPYSRAVEYQIDEIKKTATKVWEYKDSALTFRDNMCDARRLPNGNTLVNWTDIKLDEVKPDNSVAFELVYNSAPTIYRVYRQITRMNAISKIINGIGDYDFNDSVYNTGVTISVSSVTGSGLTSIEKHNYPPATGEYRDSDFSYIYPYRWVYSQYGITNINGKIIFKLNSIKNTEDPRNMAIYKRDIESIGIFKELNTTYDSTLGEITANFTGFGEFTIGSKRITSVKNINEINNQIIIFYPNPVSDKIKFSDNRYKGYNYSIISLMGETISEGIIKYDNIEISNLCPGFYFLKIGNEMIKFIKN
ncbi:MAG: aryl-sulfate sulfotransferase [FCB group bacterium]